METYGEDIGQTSWVTTAESNQIPGWLGLTASSSVLEIGCGSGRYALRLADQVGCRVKGLDVNPNGITMAKELASRSRQGARVQFEQLDCSQGLPIQTETLDAVFANDVLCHIPGRQALLEEIHRVLQPGGYLLFSDALVIGGLVSHEEIAQRASIGHYVFSSPGENERLLTLARLKTVSVTDTTLEAAQIAKKWHDAREKRSELLIEIEGLENYRGLQRFLSCVHVLNSERRLLRKVYLSRKSL